MCLINHEINFTLTWSERFITSNAPLGKTCPLSDAKLDDPVVALSA